MIPYGICLYLTSLSMIISMIISAAAAAKSLQLCPTLRPHRQQPTRLPHPWNSPGKNTGVGCHFSHQSMKVESESEVTQLCLSLCDPVDCSLPGSSIHGIFQARLLELGAIGSRNNNSEIGKQNIYFQESLF